MNKSPGSEYVYFTYIKTAPQQLWAALTEIEFIREHWWGAWLESTWAVGSPVSFWHPLDSESAKQRGMRVNSAGETLSNTGVVVQGALHHALLHVSIASGRRGARGRRGNGHVYAGTHSG